MTEQQTQPAAQDQPSAEASKRQAPKQSRHYKEANKPVRKHMIQPALRKQPSDVLV